jgi:dTDP-4-amino-4,6-dideoxygalactose transaminase
MIPIFKPYMPEGIMPEIQTILYSGQLSYGKYGKLFEQSLKQYIKNNNLITVSTYNHAMLIVLSVLDLHPGDEIIASPVSCLASNQPFAIKKINIIWADIDPATGSICPDDVRKKISSKTKAIFHNHYCGYVGQVNAIKEIAAENGLVVVDDCIEAFGAQYNGKRMGSTDSDISVFSFQTVRLPNAIDGAAISFKDPMLYKKAFKIRDYGIERTKFRDSFGEISAECDIDLEGYGALMNEVNSFIGLKQMEVIDNLFSKQRANAMAWIEKLECEKGVKPLQINNNSTPNYWVYGILCDNKFEAMQKFRNKGYYATGVHINNNIYSVFNNKTELKGVNDFTNSYLALPCGWWI